MKTVATPHTTFWKIKNFYVLLSEKFSPKIYQYYSGAEVWHINRDIKTFALMKDVLRLSEKYAQE